MNLPNMNMIEELNSAILKEGNAANSKQIITQINILQHNSNLYKVESEDS